MEHYTLRIFEFSFFVNLSYEFPNVVPQVREKFALIALQMLLLYVTLNVCLKVMFGKEEPMIQCTLKIHSPTRRICLIALCFFEDDANPVLNDQFSKPQVIGACQHFHIQCLIIAQPTLVERED